MFLLALSIAHQCTKDLFNVHSQIYSAGHVFNIYTRILPPNIFGDPNLSFRKKCKISECRQCKILKSYNVCPDLRGVLLLPCYFSPCPQLSFFFFMCTELTNLEIFLIISYLEISLCNSQCNSFSGLLSRTGFEFHKKKSSTLDKKDAIPKVLDTINKQTKKIF